MIKISFTKILSALENFKIPDFDLVIGIANGGAVPASLVAYKIGSDLKIIRINYRDEENNPCYKEPRCLSRVKLSKEARRILLVDDVSVSGKTLTCAKKLFKGKKIKTLVFKGKADYVLFPKIKDCVKWPWKE